MKVTVKDHMSCDGEIKYPCLMISTHKKFIVLFHSPTKGTVVQTKDESLHTVGTYIDYWKPATNSSDWEVFEGTIEMSNDF